MKTCSRCKQSKELDQFAKNRGQCRECQSIYEFNRREKRHEYIRQYNKKITECRRQERLQASTRKSSPIYFSTCLMTGKLFVSRTPNKRYSKEGQILRDASARHPKHRHPISEHKCHECGNSFKGTPKAKYCSNACSKKHGKRITRLIEKVKERGCADIVDRVDPIIVFNAHNWRCAVCYTHTPYALIGSDYKENQPTIDHIIPISAGGEHSYANTRLLCQQCNSAKGILIDPPNEVIQLLSLNNQLTKKIYVTEQQLTARSA